METRQLSDNSLEPELSPLHNPILAENLDLWARVYAAAPPEDRPQAIQQLLSELRAGRQVAIPGKDLPSETSTATPEFACRQCGKMNESGQKFCGFCGADTYPADVYPSNPRSSGPRSAETRSADAKSTDVKRIDDDRAALSTLDPVQSPSPFSTRQLDSLRELSFSTIYDSEESSRNGLKYAIVAIVLVACLSAIAYVQWKTQIRAAWSRIVSPSTAAGTESHAASSQPSSPQQPSTPVASGLATSAPVSSASQENSAQPAPGPSPQAAPGTTEAQSDEAASNQQKLPHTSSDTLAAENQSAPAANSSDRAIVPKPQQAVASQDIVRTDVDKASSQPLTPAARVDRVTARPPKSSLPSADNGSAELAVAQEYLNGTSGSRNPAQAATWLWKAVGKQNPTALVLLSDLYVRGDGVAKNCDQARMLLIAAARKNAPEAGARLRTFESGGCR